MRIWALALAAALSWTTGCFAAPPIWVTRDADSEIVLFGSIHVLPPQLEWRTAALEAALGKADDIWFELPVDPQTEQETARIAAAKGLLPFGQSLFALLPPKDSKRLIQMADDLGVDKVALDRMKPWLAEVALVGALYRKAGATSEGGVEAVVSAAVPPNVSRKAFETPDQQLSLFDSSTMADQIASLGETLDEIESQPDTFQDLVQAWSSGDTKGLEGEAAALRRASPNLYRRLVTDRNVAWVKVLDERLQGHGRTVVIVGVGHLVGHDGVPARLRALGYSVSGP